MIITIIALSLVIAFLLFLVIGYIVYTLDIFRVLEYYGITYDDHERTVSVTDDFEIPDAIFQKELNKRLEQEKAKRN